MRLNKSHDSQLALAGSTSKFDAGGAYIRVAESPSCRLERPDGVMGRVSRYQSERLGPVTIGSCDTETTVHLEDHIYIQVRNLYESDAMSWAGRIPPE